MAFTAAFILLFCGSCLLILSTAAPHKYVELAYCDYERKCRYHACSELQAMYHCQNRFVASNTQYLHCLQTGENTSITLCCKNHPERKLANESSCANHPERMVANVSSCANHPERKLASVSS